MKHKRVTESILYKHPRDRSRSSGTCNSVRKLHTEQGVLSRKQLVTGHDATTNEQALFVSAFTPMGAET